ncbi:MAG: type IX secretion system protein PorQ [Bacteroidota bacterium]
MNKSLPSVPSVTTDLLEGTASIISIGIQGMKRLAYLVLFSLCTSLTLTAQVGGEHIYEFLNLSTSARTTGLGGSLISVKDDDVALAYGNPAVLNPEMHQQLSFNYNFQWAGINNGYAAYGHHVAPWQTTFHGGIQFINYGEFLATDEFDQINGTFDAAEYAITLGAARQLYDKLSLGANVKFISSQFEAYSSSGISLDLAAFYRDTSGRFSATLVLKNIGGQLSTYRPDNREDLPFEIQMAISQKLKHLPLRFSITYNNFNRWNIRFDDPNAEEENNNPIGGGEPTEPSELSNNIDNFFRHLVFSGEFLLGARENFRIRVGYNHFQRKELSVANFRSLAGFSFGLGFKVSKFRIDYGRAFYHLAGGVNHLTLTTNLREFKK